jgi:L-fucose mutarotase/ribose pyranase (RbsD/FucU family)
MSDGQQLVLESTHRPGHVIVQDSQVISLQPHLPGHMADAQISLLPMSAAIDCFCRHSVDPLERLWYSMGKQSVMLCTDFIT